MSERKAKGKSGGGKRTVASVAVELDALKAEVDALRAIVATLNSGGVVHSGGVDVDVTPNSAPVVEPAPAPAEPEDPMAAVHGVLRQLFSLAKEPLDDEDVEEHDAMFERFIALIHSERKGTAMLDQSLRNYTWSQLRKKADIYLDDDGDVGSYTITRSSPESVGKRTSRVKLFLRARTRMPTPITLRRDDKDGDRWRIESSSL